ncbi:NmrA domain-containing protein [Mycena indigotica]|uniref:NmrA domain-containing protein n=1 Tax=Mycena indigotica TaxID=2126181 RepID=A0A8H6SGT4_9AGAR|nr:NmrA domain-containing protein [Mycena indigotica]KAF7298688.1 NmrA domain-containing protein [Mycena indigotica]
MGLRDMALTIYKELQSWLIPRLLLAAESDWAKCPPSHPSRFLARGLIGAPIARALLANGANVVVIVRPGFRQRLALPPEIPLHELECSEYEALKQLLAANRVQVVISTISAADVAAQHILATTAQEAGVQLFVPSEFGIVTDSVPDFAAVIEHLKSRNFPYTRFYVGFFIETIPAMMGLTVNSKINVVGFGNMPCSFTSSEDVAGFVAHVLTTVPPESLANKTFRLEGDRSTLSDLAILFDTELNFVEKVPGRMGDLWTKMQKAAECGMASTGWDVAGCGEGREECAGCTNSLWEGHEWMKIVTFFKRQNS